MRIGTNGPFQTSLAYQQQKLKLNNTYMHPLLENYLQQNYLQQKYYLYN